MATKKPVDLPSIREEMRVLNAAADEGATTMLAEANPDKNGGWLTPEFWTMATGAVTNLVTVAVLIGWITQSDAETVIKAMTALVGATQIVVVNSALIWKYIAGRTTLKASMIDARVQYHYLTAQVTEKLRAERA